MRNRTEDHEGRIVRRGFLRLGSGARRGSRLRRSRTGGREDHKGRIVRRGFLRLGSGGRRGSRRRKNRTGGREDHECRIVRRGFLRLGSGGCRGSRRKRSRTGSREGHERANRQARIPASGSARPLRLTAHQFAQPRRSSVPTLCDLCDLL
jgi:hypothetical protein